MVEGKNKMKTKDTLVAMAAKYYENKKKKSENIIRVLDDSNLGFCGQGVQF